MDATNKCKGCGGPIPFMNPGTGYCANTCHHAHKPEAFATDATDHDALMPQQESPAAFTARKLAELNQLMQHCKRCSLVAEAYTVHDPDCCPLDNPVANDCGATR